MPRRPLLFSERLGLFSARAVWDAAGRASVEMSDLRALSGLLVVGAAAFACGGRSIRTDVLETSAGGTAAVAGAQASGAAATPSDTGGRNGAGGSGAAVLAGSSGAPVNAGSSGAPPAAGGGPSASIGGSGNVAGATGATGGNARTFMDEPARCSASVEVEGWLDGGKRLAVGDWNGDDKIDLTVVNARDTRLDTLLGKGDGTFERRIDGLNLAEVPELGDLQSASVTIRESELDGNQRPDLIAWTAGPAPRALLGNGDGTFTPGTLLPAITGDFVIADLDADGHLDIAYFSSAGYCTLRIHIGIGDGTFDVGSDQVLAGSCKSMTAGDVDQDGDIDLVTTDWLNATVRVLLGNGNGSFVAGGEYRKTASQVVLDDFDANGLLDIAANGCTRGSNGVASVLLGNGDGTFRLGPSTDFTTCELPRFGRVNPDPFLDALGRRVGFGRGDGSFEAGPELLFTGAAADFNGDGLVDVAVISNAFLDVFIGQGDGTFKGCRRY